MIIHKTDSFGDFNISLIQWDSDEEGDYFEVQVSSIKQDEIIDTDGMYGDLKTGKEVFKIMREEYYNEFHSEIKEIYNNIKLTKDGREVLINLLKEDMEVKK